jgi:hypothetical protein
VAGYLVTRRFTVRLESAGQVALLEYDGVGRVTLRAPSCRRARVQVAGEAAPRAVDCRPMTLAEFVERIGIGSLAAAWK